MAHEHLLDQSSHLPLDCCAAGCCRPAGSDTGMTSGLARCSKDDVFRRCLAVHESSAGTGAPPPDGAAGRGACRVLEEVEASVTG